jgi:hypothetical protein
MVKRCLDHVDIAMDGGSQRSVGCLRSAKNASNTARWQSKVSRLSREREKRVQYGKVAHYVRILQMFRVLPAQAKLCGEASREGLNSLSP